MRCRVVSTMLRRVDVVEAIEALGGLASRSALVSITSRGDLRRALDAGLVMRTARGRYALPHVGAATQAAHATRGVLCLTSAALHHEWEVARTPTRPHVAFPTNRRLSAATARMVQVHRADLHSDLVDGLATSQVHTLEMCLRALPFDEALSVADSALRHDVRPAVLRGIAASARGPGAVQVRRVVAEATGEAANPFESVLRAIALDVPGLHVVSQLTIRGRRAWARPDLVDPDLGVVVEADSFEWHGGRAALDKDARRYNRLVVDGWIVLRFSWEQVMLDPAGVREILLAAVALSEERSKSTISARLGA